MRRKRLLLTAVVTVTVPGLLAFLAILGHEHAAAAGAEQSGAPAASGAVFSWATASQRARGLRMLTRAADAGQATSYQGTELTSESSVGGRVQTLSQVQHRADSLPAGVFGVTRSLVTLLGRHYVAVSQGTGTAAGRTAVIVGLYRSNGSLAARYWLDKRTMVPLSRELYDTADRVTGKDSFVQVKFGALLSYAHAGPAAALAPPPAQSSPAQSSGRPQAWSAHVPAARFVAALASQGWQVPGSLPGGLPLYAAESARTSAGEVADLEYSDGLYVVSLFVQRGTLASDMSGWRPVRLAGRTAYVEGQSVAWTASGFVYTMVADAPAQTVTQAVSGLPGSAGSAPAGVLNRLGRGLERMAMLADPFG